MSRTSILARLQSVELELEEKTRRAHAIEEALASDPVVAAARAELEAESAKLKTLRAALGEREFEARRLEDKIKELESRLYGGRVQNPKELDGLERELQMLKRQRSDLDDQMLQKMDEVDQSQASSASKEKSLKETQGTRANQIEQLVRERDQIVARVTTLDEQRSRDRSEVDQEALRVYDHLRRTKANRAVSFIKRDACSTCGVAVPTGLVQRARSGDELVFCSGCGRILSG